jgi:hypothetical protein
MFQFPAFASNPYVFRVRYLLTILGNHSSRSLDCSDFPSIKGGLPHSEIHGSKGIRTSPWLIAAYHVLHRLCMPRHPPNALKTLDRSHCQCPPGTSPQRYWHKKTSFSRSVRWPAVKPPIMLQGMSVPLRHTGQTGVRTYLLFTISYRTGTAFLPCKLAFLCE